jgi:hypothetical protein
VYEALEPSAATCSTLPPCPYPSPAPPLKVTVKDRFLRLAMNGLLLTCATDIKIGRIALAPTLYPNLRALPCRRLVCRACVASILLHASTPCQIFLAEVRLSYRPTRAQRRGPHERNRAYNPVRLDCRPTRALAVSDDSMPQTRWLVGSQRCRRTSELSRASSSSDTPPSSNPFPKRVE